MQHSIVITLTGLVVISHIMMVPMHTRHAGRTINRFIHRVHDDIVTRGRVHRIALAISSVIMISPVLYIVIESDAWRLLM